eukprot:6173346-Pleurochrysis_carterae.AAC.2
MSADDLCRRGQADLEERSCPEQRSAAAACCVMASQARYEMVDSVQIVNSSERMENSEVNPITGPGRSAAM